MKKITAEEFDARFDRGEEVTEFLDMSTLRRPNQKPREKQTNIDESGALKQRNARKSPANQ